MKFAIGILCILTFTFFCCCNDLESVFVSKSPVAYSFFVAGHTYGQPGIDNIGVHPSFKDKFDFIREDEVIAFGVFTGDIVLTSTEKNWDEIDSDIKLIGHPVYFSVGNHDIKDYILFESRYGKTYKSFIHNSDLIIILDPNIDNWNISGDQLIFLKKVLTTNYKNIDNIFVFFHQLLWWEPNNIYKNISLNSLEGRSENTNFSSEIKPLFNALPNNIYMFAGDVGAFRNGSEFMYYKDKNITFIASGMGGGERDNIVIVDIRKDKTVGFRLIALNGDNINSLGKLEDYVLP